MALYHHRLDADSHVLVAVLLALVLLLNKSPPVLSAATTADLAITEFLANNDAGLLRDKDGDSPDWIEIHNGGSETVNLGGLYLTDKADDKTQWAFPTVDLAADAYLVVFASAKNRTDLASELHTNFKLSTNGEYLGLLNDNGSTVISEYSPEYPPQSPDVSYGIDSSGNTRYFSSPTPGAANGVGNNLPLAQVSVIAQPDRGFHSDPISVVLTTSTSSVVSMPNVDAAKAVEIRYTTNGSEPTANTGVVYSGAPIPVTTTTVIRAAVFGEANDVTPHSRTTTFSYIFLRDVIKQPATIPGFPTTNLLRDTELVDRQVPFDTAMDPEIVQEYSNEIYDAMRAIPTMAITASLDDIFGTDGFYMSSEKTTGIEAIEKACSMEILNALNPSDNDQIDVGVKSHSHNRNKQALRLNFRKQYGNREWKTDFFRNHAPVNRDSRIADTHRTLVLRSGNNRSWSRSWEPIKTTYTVDEFYRSAQVAATGSGSHGTFVHLYINGAYWGLYNLVERPDEQFQASYNGGDSDHWFYSKHGGSSRSADSTRWDHLIGTLAHRDMGDPTNYAEIQEYLNLERFADYLIVSFYVGMTDWLDNNWYVANRNNASPLGPTPSEFFAWDGEATLDRKRSEPLEKQRNRPAEGAGVPYEFLCTTCGGDDAGEPILVLWYALWFGSSAFRDLFSGRVTKHTSPGGALTDEAMIERWDALNTHIRSAVIGESARWGDSLVTLEERYPGNFYGTTKTRDVDWQNQVDKIRDLLEGNTQQFLDEYEEWLVSPSLQWKVLFASKVLRASYSLFGG